MATITAEAAGNWSAGATWTGGVVPGDGDTADLNGKVVVMDIAIIPAAGTLLALTAAGNAGQLTVNMSATGFNGNGTINATTIQAGTPATGLIYLSVASANTLTINCTSMTGGAGGDDRCLNVTAANNIAIVGNISGGSGAQAHGFSQSAAGTVSITGNISGGAGAGTLGVFFSITQAIVVTLNNCNLINGSGGIAYSGRPPTWNLGTTNYFQHGANKFYYDVPTAANILTGDELAGVPGTYHAPEVGEVLDSADVGVSPTKGTYHEATVAEVQSGVTFGASSALTGTYAGGGGSKAIPSIGSIGGR